MQKIVGKGQNMDDITLFWTAFAAIGQAVGAVATAAAVIITLWQIKYANRKKIKMSFSDKNVVFSENGSLEFHFVNLSVSNIGNRNIIVQNWGIRVSKKQKLLFVPDIKNQIIKMIQKPLPCTLEPEQSMDLVFDIKVFVKNLQEQVRQGTFKEGDKITLYVSDSTGKNYYLKCRKSIKRYITDNQKYST